MPVAAAGPFVCVEDFHERARLVMPKNARDYYDSGADDEITLRDNVAAFARIRLMPRFLRDVSIVNLTTSFLGREVSFPLGIAPSAMQCLAHHDGELATARAAARLGVPMVLSTYSTTSLERVADEYRNNLADPAASCGGLWFQLYVYRNRATSEELIRRAERAGFQALVLTVDAPVLGRRLADLRNRFAMPPHLTLANFDDAMGIKSQSERNATATAGNQNIALLSGQSSIQATVGNTADSGMTWKDVKWLRSVTNMKIIVKGILAAEDAVNAVEWGVDGIIVSNHGGRQLDTSPATISVLHSIMHALRRTRKEKQVEVYMDGGVRRGTDIIKALAMGAKGVFVGRPALWGLAVGGDEGVSGVLEILREEFRVAMMLVGARTVEEIDENCLWDFDDRAGLRVSKL